MKFKAYLRKGTFVIIDIERKHNILLKISRMVKIRFSKLKLNNTIYQYDM